jgi:hypothetical protein
MALKNAFNINKKNEFFAFLSITFFGIKCSRVCTTSKRKGSQKDINMYVEMGKESKARECQMYVWGGVWICELQT